MEIAIRFQSVSKKFKMQFGRSRSFQEVFVNIVKQRRRKKEYLWVLKDVNFTIQRGESVALVGPNGTGKSTSLKLISGILYPDAGQIDIVGRVGSLLELGAGFHPDLTGLENIYLNGSVLGLSREEVNQRLDDIIEFSELKDFINMPVKHYSSGMFMRLGFSVAVFTNPDILLVDEVLAVGDAHFQRKCLDRINYLQQQGVTIILVSHNLGIVRKVCNRAIWMEKGHIIADGPTDTVARQYLWRTYEQEKKGEHPDLQEQHQGEKAYIEQVRFVNENGTEQDVFSTGETLSIEIHYNALIKIEQPVFGIGIHRSDGTHITGPNTRFAGYDISWIKGKGVVRYTIPKLPLLEGTYFVSLSISDRDIMVMYDYHDQMYSFNVFPAEHESYGVVTLDGFWTVEEK